MCAIRNGRSAPAAIRKVYESSVDLAQLPPEVCEQRLQVDLRARHALEQLLRHVLAVLVDVLAEPLAEWRELAAADLLVHVGMSSEIRSQSCAEATLPSAYVEEVPIECRPSACPGARRPRRPAPRRRGTPSSSRPPRGTSAAASRPVIISCSSSKRRMMEVVRRLVRVDADERRLDAVDGSVEALRVDAVQLRRERVLHEREVVLPEGRLRPTRFSHMRLCDSWSRATRRGDRRAREARSTPYS